MLAHCANCGRKWSAKDVWKLGLQNKGRACKYCGREQYISFKKTSKYLFLTDMLVIFFFLLFPFVIKLGNEGEDII
ncbi:hypothetical protein CJ485_21620 [Priestia filamentosa]|nr:hypothetical protein B1B01_04260 [Priestia filamentosa]RJS67184.1 hypothetical protein CJ485_21620 [Priestia filamentosa]